MQRAEQNGEEAGVGSGEDSLIWLIRYLFYITCERSVNTRPQNQAQVYLPQTNVSHKKQLCH